MVGDSILKKVLLIVLAIGIVSSMSGCVYSNNKGLDDLSNEEKQEVLQSLDQVREELKEDYSGNTADFALEIVDRVEKAITDSKGK
ncbi:hypothetical protein [Anaerotignum propionicum]|uniref:hypothetical protein n=1 Tax=Anaerotignum propionicum TaxID=28446 RepID=UPI00289E4BE4|nr:hypothetical protein [Anaerotignum propionicum]